jgi:hypothetical protein
VIRLPGWRWRAARAEHAAGVACLDVGHPERAAEHFRIALAHRPDLPAAWLNLGNALGAQGAHRAAIACYREAHRLDPLAPHPLVNAGYAHLTLGEWREGWWHYEQRWGIEEFRKRTGLPGAAPQKRWDGRARVGDTLLIFSEQGAGDLLQMLRYAPALEHTGMRIVWRVSAPMLRLVRQNVPPTQRVVLDSDPHPEPHDWHCPAMSLPFHMGTNRPEDVPGAGGYLSVRAHAELMASDGLTVGVVWAGNPHHVNDRNRSIPIDRLAPLFTVPGTRWVSLQVGANAHEAERYQLHTIPMFDYKDTAAVIAALDLVVAVDTSVAHLAGALGVETLILLPTPADWRWLQDRTDSPWYTSVTLHRQRHHGDWSHPISAIHKHIHTLVQRRAA